MLLATAHWEGSIAARCNNLPATHVEWQDGERLLRLGSACSRAARCRRAMMGKAKRRTTTTICSSLAPRSSLSAVGRAPILASPDEPWALSQDHRSPRATTSQRPRRRHPSAHSASPPPITALGTSATYSPPTCSGESSSSIDGARQAMSDERRATSDGLPSHRIAAYAPCTSCRICTIPYHGQLNVMQHAPEARGARAAERSRRRYRFRPH